MNKKQQQQKKSKNYEKYTKQFTPKQNYVMNTLKAFVVGGLICDLGYLIQTQLQFWGTKEKTAACAP